MSGVHFKWDGKPRYCGRCGGALEREYAAGNPNDVCEGKCLPQAAVRQGRRKA